MFLGNHSGWGITMTLERSQRESCKSMPARFAHTFMIPKSVTQQMAYQLEQALPIFPKTGSVHCVRLARESLSLPSRPEELAYIVGCDSWPWMIC